MVASSPHHIRAWGRSPPTIRWRLGGGGPRPLLQFSRLPLVARNSGNSSYNHSRMASVAILTQEAGPTRAPRFVFRYILLALLFAVVAFFQIGSTRATLRYVPVDFPAFVPGLFSSTLYIVDSKALAAGLRKGDILLAINGRPCRGSLVYFEETLKAVPGRPLAVTVRSPGPNSQDRTILLPVAPSRSWLDTKTVLISVFVLMPAFCIALGFWVVLVRPGDPLAWLLLGLLLGFSQVWPILLLWRAGVPAWPR